MRGALHQRCSTPQLPGKQPVCAIDTSRSKLVSRARPSAASASDYTTATTSTLESSVDEAAQATSCREALLSLGIPPTPPEELFDSTHIDPQDITPALLAYAPFGCVLALVRMAAWVAGIALDASWFRHKAVVDAYMALLGVTVQWEGEEHIPHERHVLVSNHISASDLLVLFQRPQRYVHLITSALPQQVYACQHLPAILQPADKATYLALAEAQQPRTQQQQQQQQDEQGTEHGQQQEAQQQLLSGVRPLHSQAGSSGGVSSNGAGGGSSRSSHRSAGGGLQQHSQHAEAVAHHQHQQQQQQHAQLPISPLATSNSSSSSSREQPSVHLFPEGGMTNGKGMMRFSRGFMLFADQLPVVPVALRARPAFPALRSHTLTSSFLANLFWCSFQPWTVLEARALPALRLGPGESKAGFVQRVQLAVAQELGVWVAELNIQQKRQLAGGGGGAGKGGSRRRQK